MRAGFLGRPVTMTTSIKATAVAVRVMGLAGEMLPGAPKCQPGSGACGLGNRTGRVSWRIWLGQSWVSDFEV